jgi:hypothetical protein
MPFFLKKVRNKIAKNKKEKKQERKGKREKKRMKRVTLNIAEREVRLVREWQRAGGSCGLQTEPTKVLFAFLLRNKSLSFFCPLPQVKFSI